MVPPQGTTIQQFTLLIVDQQTKEFFELKELSVEEAKGGIKLKAKLRGCNNKKVYFAVLQFTTTNEKGGHPVNARSPCFKTMARTTEIKVNMSDKHKKGNKQYKYRSGTPEPNWRGEVPFTPSQAELAHQALMNTIYDLPHSIVSAESSPVTSDDISCK